MEPDRLTWKWSANDTYSAKSAYLAMEDGLLANRWAQDIQGVVGLQEIGQYMQLWRKIEHTTLSVEPDRLTWKWSANSTYSAKSAYLATFHGSIACDAWKLTWKCWVPPQIGRAHV